MIKIILLYKLINFYIYDSDVYSYTLRFIMLIFNLFIIILYNFCKVEEKLFFVF
jgi:hypothetical protein